MTIQINVSAKGTNENIPSDLAKKLLDFIGTIDTTIVEGEHYLLELYFNSPVVWDEEI